MKGAIEKYGTGGVLWTPGMPSYRPGAECTVGDRKGSDVVYAAVDTVEKAREVLREKQQDPEEAAKYDTWFVIRMEPGVRCSLVADEEDY